MKSDLIRLSATALLTLIPNICPAGISFVVNTTTQEYYLSGSATGFPAMDFDSGRIFWDNGEPLNGGYINLLSLSAFDVTGNTKTNFTMFLHGNGNINGVLRLEGAGSTIVAGNEAEVYDYSGFDPAILSALEEKAANGDTLMVTSGDTNYNLLFTTVPEATNAGLWLGALVLGAAGLRRRKFRERDRLKSRPYHVNKRWQEIHGSLHFQR